MLTPPGFWLQMTEKYERNPDVPAAEDVYKKTYYYRDGKIKLEYHHAPGRITRQTRLFSKEEERRVDALEKDPVKTVRYDENVVPQLKAPKVLWENEKDCLVAMKVRVEQPTTWCHLPLSPFL